MKLVFATMGMAAGIQNSEQQKMLQWVESFGRALDEQPGALLGGDDSPQRRKKEVASYLAEIKYKFGGNNHCKPWAKYLSEMLADDNFLKSGQTPYTLAKQIYKKIDNFCNITNVDWYIKDSLCSNLAYFLLDHFNRPSAPNFIIHPVTMNVMAFCSSYLHRGRMRRGFYFELGHLDTQEAMPKSLVLEREELANYKITKLPEINAIEVQNHLKTSGCKVPAAYQYSQMYKWKDLLLTNHSGSAEWVDNLNNLFGLPQFLSTSTGQRYDAEDYVKSLSADEADLAYCLCGVLSQSEVVPWGKR